MTTIHRPDILTVARWLQGRRGFYVFAVDHPGRDECGGLHPECDGQRGKHPRGRWSKMATLDPRSIRAQLGAGLWNLGIACKQSGLLVVDEDRLGAFGAFAESIGQVVETTFTVTTAKGRHFYYRQADGAPLGNGRGRLAGHGIDVRGGGIGNGGYVVAPGSVHETGVLYAPVNSAAPVLAVPGWLAEVLRPEPVPECRQVSTSQASVYGRMRGLVSLVLDGQPHDRNGRVYWAACRAAELVTAGLVERDVAEQALVSAAVASGLRGGETEARKTVSSGLRTAA